MLARVVHTHSSVLGISSFGAPSVVLQTEEVDEHTVTEECRTRGRTLRLTHSVAGDLKVCGSTRLRTAFELK